MRIKTVAGSCFCMTLLLAHPFYGGTGEILNSTDAYGQKTVSRAGVQQPVGGMNMTPSDSPEWMSTGPFGGDVFSIGASTSDSTIVLAGIAPNGGTGGTMYRSTDSGLSWTKVTDFSGISVYCIEYTPDGDVYAGTQDGIWKSWDDGVSWSLLNINVGLNDAVNEIAIDPETSDHVWAGVADHMGLQVKNVILSTDAGVTWSDVTPPMPSPISCRGITFDPDDSDNVYAAFGGSFGGGAFWTSTDYGTSWSNRASGLPNNPLEVVVHDGSRLLVTGGQLFGTQDVGLYESTDDGASWTALHDDSWPIMAFNDLLLDPNDAAVIYLASLGAGVYLSNDGGTSWTFGSGSTAGLSTNTLCSAPGISSTIYLGASSLGILKSTDSGGIFTPSSVGIGALDVVSIAANPNNVNELAIGFQALNSGGIYSSLDAGGTWTLEPVPGTRWSAVEFHPDGTLYAISDGPSNVADEGLYRQNEDGTWTCLGPDQGVFFESELLTIEFSIKNFEHIFLGGADYGVAGDEATIWGSTDAGVTWYKVYEGLESGEAVTDIVIVQDGTDKFLLASYIDYGGTQEGGALRSWDHGFTWTESSTGLEIGAQGYSLASSPTDPFTFFYADGDNGHGGVFMTTDAGQTWSCAGFRGAVYDLVADHRNDNFLYIMQSDDGVVLKSRDGGETFWAYGTGLGTAGWGKDLAYVAGPDPHLMLASTTGSYICDLPMDHILLRRGYVNSGAGEITDVLFVNGSTGDEKRKVTVVQGTPVTVTMDIPPEGPDPAAFVLYILREEAGFGDPAEQPLGLGFSCFPMPLGNGSPLPPPVTAANNIGFEHVLGSPLLTNVPPAPSTVFSLDNIPVGTYTLQGLIYDAGSSAEISASLTNTILLEVLP